jgi:hypothetical protein
VLAALALAISLAVAPKPHIIWKPIPYGRAEGRDGRTPRSTRHPLLAPPPEGDRRALHRRNSFSRRGTFAANTPDPELGELPGTCAHFIVDRNGRIYHLVRLNVMCRHTVGLNYVAIGIEHVGTSDREILHDKAQIRASLELTAWLVDRFHIGIHNVIGHNESLSSPYHKELYKPWAHQTHADWRHADMRIYRGKLRALLREDAGL